MLTIQNKIHCHYEELSALIKKQKEDACFVVSGRFRKCPEELLEEYYAECFSQYVIQNTKLANNNPKTYSYIQSDLNTISQAQIDYIREGLRIARGEK